MGTACIIGFGILMFIGMISDGDCNSIALADEREKSLRYDAALTSEDRLREEIKRHTNAYSEVELSYMSRDKLTDKYVEYNK